MPRGQLKGNPSAFWMRDDVVLAKVRGYTAWPAMIVTGAQVPDGVMKAYTETNKQYIVRFIPAADYQFFNGAQLQPLSAVTATRFLAESRTKRLAQGLREGYELASSGAVDWARKQDAIVVNARAGGEHGSNSELKEEEQGQGDALEKPETSSETEPAPKPVTKQGPKSTLKMVPKTALNETPKHKAMTTKRSAPTQPDAEELAEAEALLEVQPVKRVRTSCKSCNSPVTTEPAEFEVDVITKASVVPTSGDVTAAAAQTAVQAQVDASRVDEFKVKHWRFELQRIFLGQEGIHLDLMDCAAEQFDRLEAFSNITAWQIHFSKINKVLKRLVSLKRHIPASVEAKYRFIRRAHKLLHDWAPLLDGGARKSHA